MIWSDRILELLSLLGPSQKIDQIGSDPIRSVRDRDRRVGGLPSKKQIGATERRWDRWSSAIGARAGSTRFGRERKRAEREKGSREEAWLGVTDWGWLGTVRKRAETENETSENGRGLGETHALFWKMVYGKIFRKPFSLFYILIFRSKQNIFRWLSILLRTKCPKILKTFSVKRFTSIQTEP